MNQLAVNSEQLPVKWHIKRLGDVLKLEYGKPLSKDQRDDDGDFPVYGANGIKCRTNKYYWDKPSIIVGRKGSAGEVRSMYHLAVKLEFCSPEIAEKRRETCLSISRQLGGFAKHLRSK